MMLQRYSRPLSILLLLIAAFINNGFAQNTEVCYNPNLVKDTSKKSIRSMALGTIAKDSVKISYHSPAVRGRVIWGGLVPFGEVWVTGAHDATTIEIGRPFVINGTEIPTGKYALFTIPGKKEWTVILNTRWQQHLASEYDHKEDIVRIKVKPRRHALTERLQYFIEPMNDSSGQIAIAWEKVRIEFPVTIKN